MTVGSFIKKTLRSHLESLKSRMLLSKRNKDINCLKFYCVDRVITPNIMNRKNLNNIFLILLFLSVILLPVLLGVSILNFSEEDNFAGKGDFLIINNFPATGMQMLLYQEPGLLGLGMSLFALFVVYLGGRSKVKRYNDRTLDPVRILIAALLKTAQIRAVFNFLESLLHPFYTNNCRTYVSHPILISNRKRSTKL